MNKIMIAEALEKFARQESRFHHIVESWKLGGVFPDVCAMFEKAGFRNEVELYEAFDEE